MARDYDRAIARQVEAAKDLLAIIGDDDELRADTIEGETDLNEAIGRALAEIDECDVLEAGLKAKIDEMQRRKSAVASRSSRLRAAIEQAMSVLDLKTIRLPTATLTLRDVKPGLEVTEEADIPARFWALSAPKLDRKAVKEALDAGEDIPGARLDNGGVSLTIRRA